MSDKISLQWKQKQGKDNLRRALKIMRESEKSNRSKQWSDTVEACAEKGLWKKKDYNISRE